MIYCQRARFAIVTVIALGACGCAGTTGPFASAPVSSYQQQQRAQRFDPYADQEAGPEILGARPLDYTDAPAEPSRARWGLPPWMTGMRPQF